MHTKVLNNIGVRTIEVAEKLGRIANLVASTFYWISKGAVNWRNTILQMVEVGWSSFPVIALTSLFTGMVLALQMGASMRNMFNEPVYLGAVVGLSLVKELGPVLTSFVIAGRIGAAIAAELGTMKVTEQLDALYTLGTNPIKYLTVPRFLACITMIPLLVAISNIIGTLGGLVVTVYKWSVPSSIYWEDIMYYVEITDIMHGLIKTFFFAAIIVFTACHQGFSCRGGAEGVGKSTTSAVMVSMVLILISDYFISAFLVAMGIG
jgi:phospholipid/cholesterol/gamma-HCH transport system permease protein